MMMMITDIVPDTYSIWFLHFLFYGFQSHGGAAYSQPNIRFHFYLHHEAAALEPFKRNATATLLECEACSVLNGTPLNCVLKFRSSWHRANHYRLHHSLWYEFYQDFKSGIYIYHF